MKKMLVQRQVRDFAIWSERAVAKCDLGIEFADLWSCVCRLLAKVPREKRSKSIVFRDFRLTLITCFRVALKWIDDYPEDVLEESNTYLLGTIPHLYPLSNDRVARTWAEFELEFLKAIDWRLPLQ